jgi:hypothetical protein
MTPFPANWGMLLDPEFQRKMRGQGLYGYSPDAALQEGSVPDRQRYAGVDLQNPSTVPAGDPSIPPLNVYDTYDQYNQVAYPYPPQLSGQYSDGGTVRIDAPEGPPQNTQLSAPNVGVVGKRDVQEKNNSVPMGLLAAGLGILANNQGHYGAAGPAIGKGGLIGVQAYGEERDRIARASQVANTNRFRDQQLADNNRLRDEQLAINRKQAGFLDRKATRQEQIDLAFADLRKQLFNEKDPVKRQAIVEQIAALSDNPESLLKMYGPQKTDRQTPFEVGTDGGMRSKAIFGPDGSVQLIGKPYEMGKGVTVNTGDKGTDAFVETLNRKAVDAVVLGSDQAKAANKTLNTVSRINEALNSGKVLAGPGTPAATTLLQLGRAINIGGKDADEILTNTRDAMQGLAQLELDASAQMKGQGQITEAERGIIRRAAAGELKELTTPELRLLMKALDKTARWKIKQNKARLDSIRAKKPDLGLAYEALDVAEPPAMVEQQDPEREDQGGPWNRQWGTK